jgi:hypothetical protein
MNRLAKWLIGGGLLLLALTVEYSWPTGATNLDATVDRQKQADDETQRLYTEANAANARYMTSDESAGLVALLAIFNEYDTRRRAQDHSANEWFVAQVKGKHLADFAEKKPKAGGGAAFLGQGQATRAVSVDLAVGESR